VAERYYQAISDLNVEWMDACLAGNAGKADLDVVTNLYVVNRVRLAYEGKDFLLTPEQYLEQGGVPQSGYNVFGISGLEFAGFRENGDTATIDARYTFWYPAAAAGEGQPRDERDPNPPAVAPVRQERTDRLTLTRVKDRWEITAIDRHVD
jgi:hypothetical protein